RFGGAQEETGVKGVRRLPQRQGQVRWGEAALPALRHAATAVHLPQPRKTERHPDWLYSGDRARPGPPPRVTAGLRGRAAEGAGGARARPRRRPAGQGLLLLVLLS